MRTQHVGAADPGHLFGLEDASSATGGGGRQDDRRGDGLLPQYAPAQIESLCGSVRHGTASERRSRRQVTASTPADPELAVECFLPRQPVASSDRGAASQRARRSGRGGRPVGHRYQELAEARLPQLSAGALVPTAQVIRWVGCASTAAHEPGPTEPQRGSRRPRQRARTTRNQTLLGAATAPLDPPAPPP